jgi:hypothetical protein
MENAWKKSGVQVATKTGSLARAVCLGLVGLLCLGSGVAHAGNFSLLVNGKAIHINPPATTDFNERNWGAGAQYDFDPIGQERHWIPFVTASGFKDSFKNPSYYAGGGMVRRFIPFSAHKTVHVDAGAVAFFMTREDYRDNHPFFGALPVLSVGAGRVALNMTFIPKVDPKMVSLLFFQLKFTFGTLN